MGKPNMVCAGIDTGKRKLDAALGSAPRGGEGRAAGSQHLWIIQRRSA